MKSKYFNLYLIDTIITFLICVIFIVISLFHKYGDNLYFLDYFNTYYFLDILFILSISLFITNITLKRRKYLLDIDSNLFPISYLGFLIIITIIAFILNYYVVVKYMHFVYYYGFIVFDYLLLNIYTLLSFKK